MSKTVRITRNQYSGDYVITSGDKQLRLTRVWPADERVYGKYTVQGDIEVVRELLGPLRGVQDLIEKAEKGEL